jgi:hypothetical protein
MKPENKTLLWSLLIGILAVSTRWTVLPLTPASLVFVAVSAALALPWAILFVLSVHRYGRKGLWILVGAPMILFWPVMFGLLVWSCEHGADCM